MSEPVVLKAERDDLTIDFSFEVDLAVNLDELWPDGDEPDVITAEVVRDKLTELYGHSSGYARKKMLDDWLAFEERVRIDVRQHTPRNADPRLAGIDEPGPPYISTDVEW